VNFNLQILEEETIEKWTLIKFFGSIENQTILWLDHGRLYGDQFKGKLFYMSKHQQLEKSINCSLYINLFFKNYDSSIDGYNNLEGIFTSHDCKFYVSLNFEYEKVRRNFK
jgi:hypothetical protein